jgi:matrixin
MILAVMLAACASPSIEQAKQEAAPVTDMRAHPVIAVDAAIATEALEAVELWTAATGGAYAPEVIIGDASDATLTLRLVPAVVDCTERTDPWGCYRPKLHALEISAKVPADLRVSTLAHEIGHSLGLAHTTEPTDLMNPDRSAFRRGCPCVLTDNVEAAGFEGPGACL